MDGYIFDFDGTLMEIQRPSYIGNKSRFSIV